MIDLPTILQPKYWFDLTPTPFTKNTLIVLLVVFAFLIILSVVLFFLRRKKKLDRFSTKFFTAAGQASLTMGLLGFLFLFFSFEQIRLLGARFWYLFWAIGLLIWIAGILYKRFKIAPKEKKAEEIRRQRAKYLPRKKK